ncbi:MAG TPA: DUF3592 domain-containing protein [Phototrophicaceae bacterium]|nr:DUF3592 domain-containing protein [Phototrophicaceae bacterium]
MLMDPSQAFLVYLIAGFFGLLGIALLVMGWRYQKRAQSQIVTDDRIETNGVNTEAKITNRRMTDYLTDGVVLYFITYQYQTAEAQSFEREAQVPLNQYKKLKVGDQITVRYLPDEPTTSYIQSGMFDAASPQALRTNAITAYVLGTAILVIVFALIYIITRPPMFR